MSHETLFHQNGKQMQYTSEVQGSGYFNMFDIEYFSVISFCDFELESHLCSEWLTVLYLIYASHYYYCSIIIIINLY